MPRDPQANPYDYLAPYADDYGTTKMFDPYAAAGNPTLSRQESRKIRNAPMWKNAVTGALLGAALGPAGAVVGGLGGLALGARRGSQNLADTNARLNQAVTAQRERIKATNAGVQSYQDEASRLSGATQAFIPGTTVPNVSDLPSIKATQDILALQDAQNKIAQPRYENLMANTEALRRLNAPTQYLNAPMDGQAGLLRDPSVDNGTYNLQVSQTAAPTQDDLNSPYATMSPEQLNSFLGTELNYQELPGKMAKTQADTDNAKARTERLKTTQTALDKARIGQANASAGLARRRTQDSRPTQGRAPSTAMQRLQAWDDFSKDLPSNIRTLGTTSPDTIPWIIQNTARGSNGKPYFYGDLSQLQKPGTAKTSGAAQRIRDALSK